MQYHNNMCIAKSNEKYIPGKERNGMTGHRPDAPDKKKLYHSLFSLVIPIAVQNLMSSLVSASDAIMLGMLDQDSLSAVSLAAQIQFVLSLFFAAIMIGTTILSAQYWGKGDGMRSMTFSDFQPIWHFWFPAFSLPLPFLPRLC